ncbi:MAG TPA: crosslink repair DNA glycosylase YcaQ family protein, partial [Jiangellaceae bacterium]
MRRIGTDERRARLAVRHHLALPAVDPIQAVRGVVALHATDPASVFISVHARTAPVDVAAIEHALYDERSLIRMLGMRRTMFVVPVELAAVVQAACTKDIAARQRRIYTKLLTERGLGDGAWL